MSDDTRTLEVLFLQEELSGKFEILSELNRYGNSILFLTRDLVLDRNVALKTVKFEKAMSTDLLELWNQNLKRCLRLDEPHLARIYTFGAINSLQYIILEYIPDIALEDLLIRKPMGLPLWKCLKLGRDISLGLHAAHNLGIVHHRLTPANIAISPDGFCRILDPGVAEGTIDALAQRPWSAEMDTSLYFSPEQIETGFSEPASDQYRLAAILFHALTGKPPFENPGEEGAFARLHSDPPFVKHNNIPEELSLIIQKALSRHPDDRYTDCQTFAHELEGLEPDHWLPDIEPVYKGATHETTIALLLSELHQQEKNRDYVRALVLCEQALTLAPYNNEVITSMLRIQKLHDKEILLRSIVNKALVAFYTNSLDDSLRILKTGRQLDRDNPEVLRLTHEVMQEQERQRMVRVLLDAARIDLAKQAFSSAMSNVIRILDIDAKNETAEKLKQRIEFGMKDRASLGIVLNQAETAFKNGRLDDAEKLVSKVLASDPQHLSAIKLKNSIPKQKKHRHLMLLWENMDSELRNGQYRKAMSVLRQIAHIEPSLKQDIRNRLIAIRKKISEQTKESLSDKAPDVNGLPEDNSMPDITDTPDSNMPENTGLIYPDASDTPENTLNETHSRDHYQKTNVFLEKKYLTMFASLILMMLILIPLSLYFYLSLPGGQKGIHHKTPDSTTSEINEMTSLILFDSLLPETSSSVPDITSQPAFEPAWNDTIETVSALNNQSETIPDNTSIQTVVSESIQSMIESGKANEVRGHYVMAAALFREVLKTYPDNDDALAGLRRCIQAIESEKNETRLSPIMQPVKSSDTASFDSIADISLPFDIEIDSIVFTPSVLEKRKPLYVRFRFDSATQEHVSRVWFNYTFSSGSSGYSQFPATKVQSWFEVTIPQNEVLGTTVFYYLNGVYDSEEEFFSGYPQHPKQFP